MGQYEAIMPSETDDLTYGSILSKCENFLQQNCKYYQKCGMVIPETFFNQFGEPKVFNNNNLIQKFVSILMTIFHLKYKGSNKLKDLLEFFRDE